MNKIAVINSGSSSLKFKLFDMDTQEILASLLIEQIGEEGGVFKNHHEALESINIDFNDLNAVGHRVVHGGENFKEATLINDEVCMVIERLSVLAPLHNPANLEGINVSRKKAPNIPQIAVFDTAFHSTLPKEAYLYALSYEMYEKHKIRRYGFHGTSHSFVAKKAATLLQKDLKELNLITIHLGNGASICAIKEGKSIDTSMGFTPLEGLVMGTRSGDLDPSVVLYMQRELSLSADMVDIELNKNSGLLGICAKSDVRDILASSDEYSTLAIDMMVRRVQKYIGSYMALLGETDALVFTGGIGENSEYIRERVLDSKLFSNLRSLVIKTDEEFEIAHESLIVLQREELI